MGTKKLVLLAACVVFVAAVPMSHIALAGPTPTTIHVCHINAVTGCGILIGLTTDGSYGTTGGVAAHLGHGDFLTKQSVPGSVCFTPYYLSTCHGRPRR